MTDAQLTALSTFSWLIGTAVMFILLAHWSAGGTWAISSAITRGLTGWTGRTGNLTGSSPNDDELGPIRSPRIDRLWAGEEAPAPPPPSDQPVAEIEDLATRRLP